MAVAVTIKIIIVAMEAKAIIMAIKASTNTIVKEIIKVAILLRYFIINLVAVINSFAINFNII